MIELALSNVEKYFGATQVLSNITFEIQEGERVGIVGGNGSGKSTIMKIIAGIEIPDKGNIMLKKGHLIGYLDQIPNYPMEYKVIDVLNIAFKELQEIQDNMVILEDKMKNAKEEEIERLLKQYGDFQHNYEIRGGYEKDEKLSKVCIGLNFSNEYLEREFNTLSGGEKTSVILGRILLENPNLLLLDEPTNHLDVETVEWLEEYLKEYKGMVLIVSHDRYFLDKVVTKIVEVEDMESQTYIGNYSTYVKEKEIRLMLEFEAYQEQEKKVKALEKAIKDLRDWAIRADNNKFFRRAASMQKRLDKMKKLDKPILERPGMKLNIVDTERSGNDVVKVTDMSKCFDEKVLFKNSSFLVRYGEKIGLIGKNGCGKTTLIKMLLGEEHPDLGVAEVGANTKIGYLPQQVVFQEEDLTVIDCFRDGITISEGSARGYLAKYLFYGNSVYKKVKSLSGGEKSRLKLSKLMFEEINFLILDEPTNHLDIEAIESLEETFTSFKGTILFISHDRYFINKIADRVTAIEEFDFVDYMGNYDYYKIKRNEKAKEAPKVKEAPSHKSYKNIDEGKIRESKITKLEEKISETEKQIEMLNEKTDEYGNDYEALQIALKEIENLKIHLEDLMEQWYDVIK